MHNLSLAESVLAMFVSRELAASIVGDLSEDAREMGSSGFWFGVLSTTFALFAQQIWECRYRISLLTICGLVLTQIALSGVIPYTLISWTGLNGHRPLLLAADLLDLFAAPLIIASLSVRVGRVSEMTTCLVLATGAFLLSIAFGSGGALATHFMQGNLIAGVSFTLCGVLARRRAVWN